MTDSPRKMKMILERWGHSTHSTKQTWVNDVSIPLGRSQLAPSHYMRRLPLVCKPGCYVTRCEQSPLSHSTHHARFTKVPETRSTSSSAGRTASCPSHHASATAPLLPSASKVLLGREDRTAKQRWCLESLTGRFVEIMGIDVLPALSPVAVLLREAQRKGEPVAWISGTRSCFYPPDLAKHGIDLAALPVVQAPDLSKAYRAADTLLRSGGFGVVVFDLCLSSDGGGDRELSSAMQVRLSSLARENTCTLLCLIRRPASRVELGSLASLRTICRIKRIGFNRFRWRLEATKDKQSQPGFHERPPWRKVCVDVHTMEKRSDQIRFTTPHRYAVRQIVHRAYLPSHRPRPP